MAYIRNKSEELTGCQAAEGFRPSVDLGCDFVMVYGIDDTMPERIRQYRQEGYVVHLMTGISWGEYQEYLEGKWDGRPHWDEAQTDRDGGQIIHNPTVPYMVPTVAFAEYLTERLKVAVDMGAEAIHVEEPEFWDASGYSEAFRREYEIYYGEPWRGQHEDLDVRYKSAKLKAYLYRRAIDRVSAALKEYAKGKYGRDLRFYVPTHSLLNYTQWKILSPEARLTEIPTVDGYIAQVWTGTSRVANVYEGICRERTFETAYLEYGAMQELVRGTGRRMWFLHDPIEDAPGYTWEDYRYNYLKTAAASLLHPLVWRYEICPWPHRVFEGSYPRVQPRIAEKNEESFGTEQSKPIPTEYATLLSSMFQLFGDMDQSEAAFEGTEAQVGVFLSDSALFQRTFPDGTVTGDTIGERLRVILGGNSGAPAAALVQEILQDGSKMHEFVQSTAFPQFFGMAMPLLKYGLPIRPVQLDNVRRFAGYLEGMDLLILSYEHIKPEGPDVNASLVSWVRQGGILLYIGDGSDPYHGIDSWWRQAGYGDPAQHLFELAEMGRGPEGGLHPVGKGSICVWNLIPAGLCLDRLLPKIYRKLVQVLLAEREIFWQYSNNLTLRRGPYIISAVMDESVDGTPKVFDGLYADMLENDYKIISRKEVKPDENTILFDFSKISQEDFRIIGTSARVEEAEVSEEGLRLRLRAADRIRVYVRLRLPCPVKEISALDGEGGPVVVSREWEERSRTLLLSYESRGLAVCIEAAWQDGESGDKIGRHPVRNQAGKQN